MELKRDQTRLSYELKGQGDKTFVFIHGVGGDHTHLAPLSDHFARQAKTLSVDLRGHGQSDKPVQEYSMEGYAEDIHWLCQSLKISHPVLVGFSMGGTIALQVASSHPTFPAAVIVLDSPLFFSEQVTQALHYFLSLLHQDPYHSGIQHILEGGSLPTDQHKGFVARSLFSTPKHVWTSSFSHMIHWDQQTTERLKTCQMPLLYVEAANQLADLLRFKEACPQLMHGKVIGSGHFVGLEAPAQVIAMIEQFLTLY